MSKILNKTILFDLDGTLIDSTSAILESFDASFKFHNKPTPSHEKIKSLIGHTLDDMFLALGVAPELVNSYFLAYKEHYHGIYLAQTKLLPYAKEAVVEASKFAKLGIVTTKGSAMLENLLKNLGIFSYFKAIVGRQDVIKPKPDAEPINTALSRLNMLDKKHLAFMIGDTPIDTMAAKNAQITPLSLLCGYSNYEILSQTNDKIFTNPLEAVIFAKNFKE